MIQPDSYVRSLLQRAPGETVTARGWVKTRRDSKNVHFIQLNDGSSAVDLQIVLDAGVIPVEQVASITTGACHNAFVRNSNSHCAALFIALLQFLG